MQASAPTTKRPVRSVPFGAPHVFVLVAVAGPDRDRLHRIAAYETTIGRDDGADLALTDGGVSKHHCTVRCDAGFCHVVDAGSTNGTRVNGRPVRPGVAHRLRHLDEIDLGASRFLFLAGRFTESRSRTG